MPVLLPDPSVGVQERSRRPRTLALWPCAGGDRDSARTGGTPTRHELWRAASGGGCQGHTQPLSRGSPVATFGHSGIEYVSLGQDIVQPRTATKQQQAQRNVFSSRCSPPKA